MLSVCAPPPQASDAYLTYMQRQTPLQEGKFIMSVISEQNFPAYLSSWSPRWLCLWLCPPSRAAGHRTGRAASSPGAAVRVAWLKGKSKSWKPVTGLTLQPLALAAPETPEVCKRGACWGKQTHGRRLSADQKPDSPRRSRRGAAKDTNFPVHF